MLSSLPDAVLTTNTLTINTFVVITGSMSDTDDSFHQSTKHADKPSIYGVYTISIANSTSLITVIMMNLLSCKRPFKE